MSKKLLFVIRKYVRASSAAQAIKLDKKTPPHDVWVDDEFKKTQEFLPAIGFDDNHDPKTSFEDQS